MNKTSRLIELLDLIGNKHSCELYLPPFNNTDNPFFKVDEIKQDALAFRDFMIDLKSLDVDLKFVEIDGKKDYLQIKIKGRK